MSQINYESNGSYAIYSRDNRLKFLVPVEGEHTATLDFWDLLIRKKGEQFSRGQTVDLRIKGFAYVM
ncbi:hypothetical protein ACFL5V_06545 [Fibrobacterota bacterium]